VPPTKISAVAKAISASCATRGSALWLVGCASAALLFAGCSLPQRGPNGLRASNAPSAVTVTADPLLGGGTKPALCDAPQPARLQPFPFNKDAARRDAMVGAGRGGGRADYVGGVASFDDLDAAELAWLLNEKFIDPDDAQNAAPSVWLIFRFLCEHPTVRASGYVVSLERLDYRTAIDDIYAPVGDPVVQTELRAFCVGATMTFNERLECFWD
jgi:hypothetical protein